MKPEDLATIEQLEDFLSGTRAVAFSVISDKDTCYRWFQGELVKFRYLALSRQGKGVVIRYRRKGNGYSRQQLYSADCPVPQDRPTPAPPAHGVRRQAKVHGSQYPSPGRHGQAS